VAIQVEDEPLVAAIDNIMTSISCREAILLNRKLDITIGQIAFA
jgi:hypothetical protein